MLFAFISENFPFALGFATCAGAIVAAVAAKHVWPKLKAVFAIGETAAYRDYKAAINFIDEKVNGLSNAAASAVNAIRGDVATIRGDLAMVQARLVALEKAVGINVAEPAPTVVSQGAAAAPPAPVSLT